jgi:hypothetical protein
MKRTILGMLVIGLLIGMLPRYAAHAVSPCTLCILEVSTQGLHGEEDQDFVIVANVGTTKISSSGIQLRYFTDKGLQANIMGIGTFEAGQVKVYASKPIADVNGSVTGVFDFGLYSGGGSVQIARTSTTYDKVGWGTSVTAETAPVAAAPAGATLARKRVGGVPQDTDNNALDLELTNATCQGVDITEIQPFVADLDGRPMDAWLEVTSNTSTPGDCLLTTKAGDTYTIPSADLPHTGETKVLNRGLDAQGQITSLHFGEVGGQVWLGAASAYPDTNGTPVRMPLTSVAYSNLKNGQSWALVDGLWRRTYQPTPGEPNVYQADATVSEDDPTACEGVRITELLPNPSGEDTGHEWIEITNESSQPESLSQCQINLAGEIYRFLPDDVLGAGEWRMITELFDANQSPKVITLRNSDESNVLLQRVRADGTLETIQSFVYKDAPEGQSWARFAAGWRWEPLPTPGLDNTTPPPPAASEAPTEFPEAPQQSGAPGVTSVTITELLPNPAAPATDDSDEFVELYNSGDEPVDLAGYKLQTGNSYSYSFTLTDQIIPAKGYLVITSGGSNLSLANSGGRARLLGPGGEVIAETVPYVDALEGNAWALVGGIWQWTANPTPGADNQMATPVLSGISKTKASASTTKKASTAVKSASKTAKSTTPKAPKTSSASNTKPTNNFAKSVANISPVHPVVLAVVGSLAVLYAAYEYRQDIANRIYQFRRNRSRR